MGLSPSAYEMIELAQARYPGVFIITHEEYRVRDAFGYYVDKTPDMNFFSWSCSRGLLNAENTVVDAALTAPQKVLKYILAFKNHAVFMLQDIHHYLDVPLILRLLRDAGDDLIAGSLHRFIVMTMPVHKPVADLEKCYPVVHHALPTRGEIIEEISVTRQDYEEETEQKLPTTNEDLADRAAGMTLREVSAALALGLVRKKGMDFDVDTMLEEKRRAISRSQVLEYIGTKEGMGDVGGMDNLKAWLDQRRDALFNEEAWDFGLPKPKGILMLGPPGTGKSLMAQVISSHYKIPLIRMNMDKIFGRYVGMSESNLRTALETVKAISPCVLHVDEIEKGLAGSSASSSTDSGVASRVLGSLLTWMQENKEATFVVATANDVRALPPELLRKGRFDELFYAELPAEQEREDIFLIHLRKRLVDTGNIDLSTAVQVTHGFSGAEIEQCVIDALFAAWDEGRVAVTDKHLVDAARATVPLSKSMEEKLLQLREWAQSHARHASSEVTMATPKKRVARRPRIANI